MEKAEDTDRTLEAFKKSVRYLRGSLWWVRNDLLKERQQAFNQRDTHIGHPVLSIKSCPIETRLDTVPMLMGTSGNNLTAYSKSQCVAVSGLTKKEPGHMVYFGSIVEPGLYSAGELLDGVIKKKDAVMDVKSEDGCSGSLVRKPWYEYRVMAPNWDKTMVDAVERKQLDEFCARHGM